MLGGPGIDANLAKAKAHWLSRDTIAWNVEPVPDGSYALHWAPAGGLEAGSEGVTGGQSIPLRRARDLGDLAEKHPHLAGYLAFRIAPEDLAKVPEALKGQLAVSVSDEAGGLRAATGVQIPGVLDDLYANDLELGPVAGAGTTTLRLWAPTAKSVALRLYDGDSFQTLAMSRDDATGTWSASGGPSWLGKQYLYDVEVWAPAANAVVHNLVTDPYSLGLTTNSARSVVVDLDDPALAPRDWASTRKPPLRAFEDVALYELHVRDFSVEDETVPAADRGTYRAFTDRRSDGTACSTSGCSPAPASRTSTCCRCSTSPRSTRSRPTGSRPATCRCSARPRRSSRRGSRRSPTRTRSTGATTRGTTRCRRAATRPTRRARSARSSSGRWCSR
jgi:hypothetical protein